MYRESSNALCLTANRGAEYCMVYSIIQYYIILYGTMQWCCGEKCQRNKYQFSVLGDKDRDRDRNRDLLLFTLVC